jgi:hypothetical protein
MPVRIFTASLLTASLFVCNPARTQEPDPPKSQDYPVPVKESAEKPAPGKAFEPDIKTLKGGRIIGTEGNIVEVAWADVTGDGEDEILYADYYGVLRCRSRDGKQLLWSVDLDGFPFMIKAYDMDGDGTAEVLAACGTPALFLISSEGKIEWRLRPPGISYAITCGRILANNKIGIVAGGADGNLYVYSTTGVPLKTIPPDKDDAPRQVKDLDAADLDGDGHDEVIWTTSVNGATRAMRVDDEKLLWKVSTGRLFTRNLKPGVPGGRCRGFGVSVFDITGDRIPEVIHWGGSAETGWAYEVISSKGGSQWIAKFRRSYHDMLYGPVILDGEKRILTFFDNEVRIHDASGNELEVFTMGIPGFRASNRDEDLVGLGHPGFLAADFHDRQGGSEVLLASAPLNDRDIYIFTINREGLDILRNLGVPRSTLEINAQVSDMMETLSKRPPVRNPKKIYTMNLGVNGSPPPDWIEGCARDRIPALRKALPFPNIRYFSTYSAHEDKEVPGIIYSDVPQGRKVSREEILEVARTFEKNRMAWWLVVGHGANGYFTMETLEEVFEASPDSLVGVTVSEEHQHRRALSPLLAKRVDAYLEHFIIPLLDLCLKHRKKLEMRNYSGFWTSMPAMKRYYDIYFKSDKYRDVIVPSVEGRALGPEMLFMAQFGLWYSGLVSTVQLSQISDQIRLQRNIGAKVIDGTHYLREAVAMVASGMCRDIFFRVEGMAVLPAGKLNPANPYHRQCKYQYGDMRYGGKGFQALLPLIYLIGTGVLEAPDRDQIVGMAPVAFRFTEPSPVFMQPLMLSSKFFTNRNYQALFGLTENKLTTTQDEYILKHVSRVKMHTGNWNPQTPYGLPMIYPAHAPDLPGIVNLRTDGNYLLEGDRKIPAREAKEKILRLFEEESRTLPVRVDGCFWAAHKRDPQGKTIRLTMIDPDLFGSKGPEVEVFFQKGNPVSIHDLVEDRRLEIEDGTKSIKMKIPRGLFRIVDIHY